MAKLNARKPEPLEATIQHQLITGLERRGWYVQKTEGRSRNGYPDVTAVDTDGNVWFIELKRTVGHPSPDQCRELRLLAQHGANVMLAYGRKAINLLLAQPDWNKLKNTSRHLLTIDSKGQTKWN